MVATEVDDGLEGDYFATFGTHSFDDGEDDEVLEEDGVDGVAVDPDGEDESEEGGVEVLE